MKLAISICIALAMCIGTWDAPTIALAGESEGMEAPEDGEGVLLGGELMMGAGVEFETSPYKDVDDEFSPSLYIRWEKDPMFVEIEDRLRVGYEWRDFTFSAIAQYQDDGYDEDDGDFLEGMDERKSTVAAGLEVEYETPFGEVGVEMMADVGGKHKGWEMSLDYGKSFELDRFFIQPFVEVNWQSGKMADYYYGVKDSEARSWRPAYDPGSVVNFEVGFEVFYMFSEHWMLVGRMETEFLDGDIKDSPIVDEDVLYSGSLGIVYAF